MAKVMQWLAVLGVTPVEVMRVIWRRVTGRGHLDEEFIPPPLDPLLARFNEWLAGQERGNLGNVSIPHAPHAPMVSINMLVPSLLYVQTYHLAIIGATICHDNVVRRAYKSMKYMQLFAK